MSESVATASTDGRAMPEPTVLPTRNPWDQQPGENNLWYVRFMRFVALGPTRSVSLVATGRRNAYPIPAHWPIQAKQHRWRERAGAFDTAVRADKTLAATFAEVLTELVTKANITEQRLLREVLATGGYKAPAADDLES